MTARQILVLGGGFAGLWSAVGAARKLDELGSRPGEIEITLVNPDPYHNIRVRNYESDLRNVRVPLDDVLGPIGVHRIEGVAEKIDPQNHSVQIGTNEGTKIISYDRLVFALGSQLARPNIPGLSEHSFDIDTYTAAIRLNNHLAALPSRPATPGLLNVVVVGAGLTGIELATELPGRLKAALEQTNTNAPFRVILVDHNPRVGSEMGDSARPVIESALTELGIETRLGVVVSALSATHVTLDTGEQIPTDTVVWCAGMRAHPLTRFITDDRDASGRIPVDELMRVKDVPGIFAAGDAARAMLDVGHSSVMSCQHSRPMGRFAGHNVVCDLLGLPMLPLSIDWYVTVLDLGPCGAVYTMGWDRKVVADGSVAKQTKQNINQQRIYPPLNGNRAEILAAAAPTVQSAPRL